MRRKVGRSAGEARRRATTKKQGKVREPVLPRRIPRELGCANPQHLRGTAYEDGWKLRRSGGEDVYVVSYHCPDCEHWFNVGHPRRSSRGRR